jgi:hypothetical protein
MYRDKAIQAHSLARFTTTPDVIASLEKLALEYDQIADSFDDDADSSAIH